MNARSLDRAFTYSVPAQLRDLLRVGSTVRVPFGRQTLCGYVVALTDCAPDFATKPVLDKAVDEDPLDEEQVALARWLAARYRCTLAEALKCFLPPGAGRKAERQIALTDSGRAYEAELTAGAAPNQIVVLRALREGAGPSGVSFESLAALFGKSREAFAKAGAAIRALQEKGLVEETRRMSRPRRWCARWRRWWATRSATGWPWSRSLRCARRGRQRSLRR